MAQQRFFDLLGPLTVNEIAALSGAAISDSGQGEIAIDAVAPLDALRPGALGYLESRKLLEAAGGQRLDGIALIAPEDLAADLAGLGAIVLKHETPRAAFARAASGLYRLREHEGVTAIHPKADIHPSAKIGPNAVIGQGAIIGEDVVIGANAVIGPDCRIGKGSRIGANVSLRCTDIGETCNILAGAVLGEAGFGVAVSKSGAIDVPHLGRVELGDAVTIGANSCVDRAVFGATRLGDRCKIDNLSHIAHNVSVGEDVLMAAFAGVSGSTKIGARVVFGGRVGLADHIQIGDDVTVGGGAAVMNSLTEPGIYAGAPAQPLRDHLREVAQIRRLVKAKAKKDKS